MGILVACVALDILELGQIIYLIMHIDMTMLFLLEMNGKENWLG